MLTDDLKINFVPLKSEFFQLCLSLYSYRSKYDNLSVRLVKSSRFFLLEEITALRAISNEIILQLCKLDEDKSKVSFHAAKKEINKLSISQDKIIYLNKSIKNYRKAINTIKNKSRNNFIAHLTENGYPDPFNLPDFKLDLLELVKSAYCVFVQIWGDEVNFSFKLGSQERILNFNQEFKLKSKT